MHRLAVGVSDVGRRLHIELRVRSGLPRGTPAFQGGGNGGLSTTLRRLRWHVLAPARHRRSSTWPEALWERSYQIGRGRARSPGRRAPLILLPGPLPDPSFTPKLMWSRVGPRASSRECQKRPSRPSLWLLPRRKDDPPARAETVRKPWGVDQCRGNLSRGNTSWITKPAPRRSRFSSPQRYR